MSYELSSLPRISNEVQALEGLKDKPLEAPEGQTGTSMMVAETLANSATVQVEFNV